MKILFISDNFPPEVNAPATRTYEHCLEWVKLGAEVTVITCFPNFPQGKIYSGYKNKLYQREEIDGIKVIRVWSYITANEGFLRRTSDYISFGISAFFASFLVKTDIIIATSPQFFAALSGFFISVFKRKPWIMEVRDLWPESIRAVGAIKNNNILSFLESTELFLYRTTNAIVVVTDAFKENIAIRGINRNKIYVIKNGVHLDKFMPREKNSTILDSLFIRNKFVISYLGTHGMAHKLDFILECARETKNPNIHYLLIGDGAEKENLLNLKDKWNLKNVTMISFVPKNEIVEYISITDLSLVNLKKSDTFKTVIPSKIFENAAMQKPIFLGVEGEAQGIINQYKAGICFEPENKADFLEKLEQIYLDKNLYTSHQEGCKELAQAFDRKSLAKQMFEVISLVAK